MELIKFIFSNFWIFIGFFMLSTSILSIIGDTIVDIVKIIVAKRIRIKGLEEKKQ